HLGQHAAQRRLGEAPGHEQHAARRARRGSGAVGQRGSPLRTNLLGVPASAPPAAGRHSATASIWRASAESLSVMPPALWVDSLTVTRPHVTERSGWWYAASAQYPIALTSISVVGQPSVL